MQRRRAGQGARKPASQDLNCIVKPSARDSTSATSIVCRPSEQSSSIWAISQMAPSRRTDSCGRCTSRTEAQFLPLSQFVIREAARVFWEPPQSQNIGRKPSCVTRRCDIGFNSKSIQTLPRRSLNLSTFQVGPVLPISSSRRSRH